MNDTPAGTNAADDNIAKFYSPQTDDPIPDDTEAELDAVEIYLDAVWYNAKNLPDNVEGTDTKTATLKAAGDELKKLIAKARRDALSEAVAVLPEKRNDGLHYRLVSVGFNEAIDVATAAIEGLLQGDSKQPGGEDES